MKGTILRCLGDMVTERYGEEPWKRILRQAGLDDLTKFSPSSDVDDAVAGKVFAVAGPVLERTAAQVFDDFSTHWVETYAPKVYPQYYGQFKSTKEFLLGLDRLHSTVTRNLEGARPPRFQYTWRDENTLRMTYESHRGLVDLFASLARALGRHFGEEIAVRKIGGNLVEVRFPDAS